MAELPGHWVFLDFPSVPDTVRLRLDANLQRRLKCVVGEDVFLEYPFAYVPKSTLESLSREPGSIFECHKSQIEAYELPFFLVGYSSLDLSSNEFVICLSEKSHEILRRRNREISRNVSARVSGKIWKSPGSWDPSSSGTVSEESSLVANARPFFVTEVSFPLEDRFWGKAKLGNRDAADVRDGHVELLPDESEDFENVDMRLVSLSVQTNLRQRDVEVQTYPGYPKNAWTQHEVLGNREVLGQEDDPRVSLQRHVDVVTETVDYNAAINMHTDDIENLPRNESLKRTKYHLQESLSLLCPELTGKLVVAGAAFSSTLVAISYVPIDLDPPRILLWSLSDSLCPRIDLELAGVDPIHALGFSPGGETLLGGSSSGRIYVWPVNEGDSGPEKLPVAATSDSGCSHAGPVRRIEFLPRNFRLEDGKFLKVESEANSQFATCSDDGTVAFWDLHQGLATLRPIFRIVFPTPERAALLSFCWTGCSYRDVDRCETTRIENLQKLWLGTAEGEFLKVRWSGEEPDRESCEILERSQAHDGPVLEVARCPYLPEVVLSIGGSVFALWQDDFLKSPLLWRKSRGSYACCCWSSRPCVFLLGRFDGDVEVWDVRASLSQPIKVETVSGDVVTGLYAGKSSSGSVIGVSESDKSAFRIFPETGADEEDDLERMDWMEEFVWKETRRKKVFRNWQSDFLENDPRVAEKRRLRLEEEEKRKLEEARVRFQREQEELLRREAEKRAKSARKSAELVWKSKDLRRMKSVLLEKKGFEPRILEKRKEPLVQLQEQRRLKMARAIREVQLKEKRFEEVLDEEVPEFQDIGTDESQVPRDKVEDERMAGAGAEGEFEGADLEGYLEVKRKAKVVIESRSFQPVFTWTEFMAQAWESKLEK